MTTIIQSNLTRSNQTLSQIMFAEVARVLSRHHPRLMKHRKVGPERGVVEADAASAQVCELCLVASSTDWHVSMEEVGSAVL